jgi:transcriptional accessory protein Tex/SPT6
VDAKAIVGCLTPYAGHGEQKIELHLSLDARARLWRFAEDEAIRVFAAGIEGHLLDSQRPLRAYATIGFGPGFRTGVKVAVIFARNGKNCRHYRNLSA